MPAGIYGVGKAAVHQPALAVLSHTPPGATETICWAGKGIVYDTGGLSIKTKVKSYDQSKFNPLTLSLLNALQWLNPFCTNAFCALTLSVRTKCCTEFTDGDARYEERLRWCSWHSWSIRGGYENGDSGFTVVLSHCASTEWG